MSTSPLPDRKSEATLRGELAAALRLADHFGFSEGICNHFSVVVPGNEERFLINPYGFHWSELSADHLLLIDGEGAVHGGEGEVEDSAKYIHIAGHRANPRHQVILHVHMPWATSLTMVEGGRLEMAHQSAVRFHGRMAHHSFGGVALDAAEGERIAEAQAGNPDADVIFLDNHGVSVCGPTMPRAFHELYYLERACRQQVLAMSTGLPLKIISDDVITATKAQYGDTSNTYAEAHFTALRRAHGL